MCLEKKEKRFVCEMKSQEAHNMQRRISPTQSARNEFFIRQCHIFRLIHENEHWHGIKAPKSSLHESLITRSGNKTEEQ